MCVKSSLTGTSQTTQTGDEQPHCKFEQTHTRGRAFIDAHTHNRAHMHAVTDTCVSVTRGKHRNTVLVSWKAVVVKDIA